MWNQARKSYRSPQQPKISVQRFSINNLTTPVKLIPKQNPRQCPFHFSQPTHICLTCRKSICLRCALTFCQQHIIKKQNEALQTLRQQLIKLEISPCLQQLQLKLLQSKQRQEYLQKKIIRLIQNIQSRFDYIIERLSKKKLQIIQYYDTQFQKHLEQHQIYDKQISTQLQWMKNYIITPTQTLKLHTIQQIDDISAKAKDILQDNQKIEKKITKILMSKQKINIQKIWNEQKLQKILYQIQNIQYKIDNQKNQKKKRIITQNTTQLNNTLRGIKSSANSRFPSGRKQVTPST